MTVSVGFDPQPYGGSFLGRISTVAIYPLTGGALTAYLRSGAGVLALVITEPALLVWVGE